MYKCESIKNFAVHFSAGLAVFLTVFFTAQKCFCGMAVKEGIFMPVIMYHSVCGKTPSEYTVTPQQFESDLLWLKNNGYKSVTAEELVKYTNNSGSLPEKCVMITLDDGYYNNLSEAVPILEKYGMSAVVSVVGYYTDNIAPADPHVADYSYLTWEDINGMLDSGVVELGNHTYNMHSFDGVRKGCAKIKGETNEEYINILKSDISLLQSEFQENTGISPIVFAYPFGEISREALPVLRECGFLITLNCSEKPNYITRNPECLYGIFRYNRSGLYSTESFMRKILVNS